MKKPFFTLGALVGAVGLVGIILAGMSDISMSTPMLLLVTGLVLLLVGFFRGESKG